MRTQVIMGPDAWDHGGTRKLGECCLFKPRRISFRAARRARLRLRTQLEEEHDDSLQSYREMSRCQYACHAKWSKQGRTNSTTSMRRCPESKGVNIALHLGRVDTNSSHTFLQHGCIMQSLGSRENLLSSHKEIVRVGQQLHSVARVSILSTRKKDSTLLTGLEGSGMV